MNTVVTIVGSVIVFVVVFGFAAYTRYLQHKETMAQAEKGLLPEGDSQDKSQTILRWGMIFSIVGAILVLVLIPFAWDSYWILFLLGLLPLALGLGMLLIYIFTQENPAPKDKKGAKDPPKAKKPAASKAKKSPAKKSAK